MTSSCSSASIPGSSASTSSACSSRQGQKRKRSNMDDDSSCNDHVDDPDIDDTSWIREDLEALGVFYAKQPVTLSFLTDKLKQTHPSVNVPKFLSHFKTLLNDQLLFDLDMMKLDDPTGIRLGLVQKYVDRMSPKIDREMHKLCVVLSDALEENLRLAEITDQDRNLFKVMFMKWCYAYAPDFAQECQNLMDSFANVRWEDTEMDAKYVRAISEEAFTGVAKAFTRIFFLDPVVPVGLQQKRIRINGKLVNSVPDLSFHEYDVNGKSKGPLFMFFKVKRASILKPTEDAKEVWIANRVSSDVLGQVGAELLSEVGNTPFYPNVLGVLCMRTEIMFVLLEMTEDHAHRVIHGDVTGDRATIYYSETFDILKAEDRVKVCNLLLMLASCQKCNFHRHYIRQ